MRLFKASAKNEEDWSGDDFYIVAEDFVSALVKAEDVMPDLALHLELSAEHRAGAFRIRSIEEIGEVLGDVATTSGYKRGMWATAAAKRLAKKEGESGEGTTV